MPRSRAPEIRREACARVLPPAASRPGRAGCSGCWSTTRPPRRKVGAGRPPVTSACGVQSRSVPVGIRSVRSMVPSRGARAGWLSSWRMDPVSVGRIRGSRCSSVSVSDNLPRPSAGRRWRPAAWSGCRHRKRSRAPWAGRWGDVGDAAAACGSRPALDPCGGAGRPPPRVIPQPLRSPVGVMSSSDKEVGDISPLP